MSVARRLANARAMEKKFREFFLSVAAALRVVDRDAAPSSIGWRSRSRQRPLLEARDQCAADVRARFLDDFDTPNAVKALQRSWTRRAATYRLPNTQPSSLALCAAARYVAETWLKLGVHWSVLRRRPWHVKGLPDAVVDEEKEFGGGVRAVAGRPLVVPGRRTGRGPDPGHGWGITVVRRVAGPRVAGAGRPIRRQGRRFRLEVG